MILQELFEATYTAYHGTGAKFDQFQDSFMKPHFFTMDRKYATAYVGGKTVSSPFLAKKKTKNYLLTVEINIEKMFDTKHDPKAVEFYNTKFLPVKNKISEKYRQPLIPEIKLGQYVSFVHADDFWRYCSSYKVTEYDGMLVDEGSASKEPAIVPFHASQIRIIKRQIVKF